MHIHKHQDWLVHSDIVMRYVPVSSESEVDEEHHDKETLLLTVEALKAQLEEQTRLCKEQVQCIYTLIIYINVHACIQVHMYNNYC